MGERLYHLMADTEAERRTWVSGLKVAISTAKELNKGGVSVQSVFT